MATQKDLDEKQEGIESQEKEEIVANLCFMADIVFEEENEVLDSEPGHLYDDLQKAYDELLDDSQTLASYYALLKKNFQKLFLELENFTNEKEKLGQEISELLKENTLLQKDVTALRIEVF